MPDNFLKKGIRNLYHHCIRFFFPVRCMSCRKILPETSEIRICQNCLPKVQMTAQEERTLGGGQFAFGLYSMPYLDGVTSALKYTGGVRKAMLNFKFYEKTCHRHTFAYCMSLRKTDLPYYDFIIAVPISKERRRERGYNQTDLIAEDFAHITGTQLKKDILMKTKHNQRQSELSTKERLANVRGVYRIDDDFKVDKKSILLIDDIYTTGSTVNECAKILKQAGAKRVHVLAACRAVRK